jgi:hypothetical protein
MPRLIEQIRRLPYNSEEVGMGFNSDTGKAVGTALEFSPPVGGPGQTNLTEATIISSQHAFSSAMSMSMEVSGHYGMVSAGLKAEFQKESTFNSTSTFLLARSKLENQIKRGTHFRVNEVAQRLLQSNRFDDFQNAFGDSFVRGVFTGGEYYALIRMTSIDRTMQTRLALTLQAEINGGLAGGAFSAAYNQANRSSESRSEYHIKFYQRGGAGREISATIDLDEMKARLREFPEAIRQHPFPYEIEVARYDTVPLPIPPKEQQENFLLALADADAQRLKYIQVRNDCAFAAEHPEFFISLPSVEVLLRATDLYTRALNAVIGHAIALTRGEVTPDRFFFNPAAAAPPLELPQIRLKRRTSEHARTFVDWFTLRTTPGILHEDRQFLDQLERDVSPRIQDYQSIQDPGGNQQATDRARAVVLRPILELAKEFNLTMTRAPSLGHLPDMVPAGLETLRLMNCDLADIRGIGRLSALRELALADNQISDISELAELTQLRALWIQNNKIRDLTPLLACTELEVLSIAGNLVFDLGPIAGLTKLNVVVIGMYEVHSADGQVTERRHRSNPVVAIDPLSRIPALANPFLSGNKLSVQIFGAGGAEREATAERVGRTPVFRIKLPRNGVEKIEEWSFQSFWGNIPNPNDPLKVSATVGTEEGFLEERWFDVARNDRSTCVAPASAPGNHPVQRQIEVRILA